jgi:hypothetical protein
MSELLKQVNKLFPKANFKNGMVVELDTRKRRLFWEGRFIDGTGYIPLGYYDNELNNMDTINHTDNINKIYLSHDVGYFEDFFRDASLTEIWRRE